jgi:hypothetical protein
MYEIDPKFLNEDGSINYDTACAAGRSAHAKEALTALKVVWRGPAKIAIFCAKRALATIRNLATGHVRVS